MVQELLKRGAVLRGRDADRKTPMERAVRGWDVLKVGCLGEEWAAFSNKLKGHAKGDDVVRDEARPNERRENTTI